MFFKRFLKDTLIYSLPNFISKAISIVLVPIYTKYMSPETFGVVDMLTIVGTLLNYLICFELTQALARFIVEKDNYGKKIVFSTVLFYSFFASIIFFVIFYLFRKSLASLLLDSIDLTNIILISTIAAIINGFNLIIKSNLRFNFKSIQASIINVISVILLPTTTLFFLIYFENKALSIFYSRIITGFVCLLFGVIYNKNSIIIKFDFKLLKQMIMFSFPLVVSSLMTYFATFIDRFMIKEMLSLEELGIYSIAARFASILMLLTRSVATALSPLVYSFYKDKKAKSEMIRIFNLYIFFGGVILIELTLVSKYVFIIFTTQNYYYAYKIMPILILAMLINSFYIFFPGLTISMKTKQISYISISTLIINSICNFLLIKNFGSLGAAYATLIGFTVGSVLTCYYSQREYKIDYSINNVVVMIIIFIVIKILDYFSIFDNYNFIRIIAIIFIPFLLFFVIYNKKISEFNKK